MKNFIYTIIKAFTAIAKTLKTTITNKEALAKKTSLILISAMLIILILMIFLIRYRGLMQTDVFLSRDLQAEGDTIFRKQAIFYIFNAISFFGKPIIAAVMIITTALIFYCLKYYRESVFILLTSLSAAINWLIKLAIHRPRPNSGLIQILAYEGGYSFPSGHVTFYTVFFGFLFLVLFFTTKINRVIREFIQTLCLILIVLVSFSRIYLGVHWLSDTLGSYLLGAIILLILRYFYLRKTGIKS